MSSTVAGRILMVDDEPSVLAGYRRALHGRFAIEVAPSGAEGLVAVEAARAARTPFQVVVSDMMMPAMNGAAFLAGVRRLEPGAVQLLLSGQADLESTIAAVNDGNLFRVLTKPCDADDLAQALAAALEQHRLVHAERELLERTLAGTVDVLTELVSMASPDAFARTERLRALVDRVAGIVGVEDWRLPLAAMLSQVGCLAVPPEVLRRARSGARLDDAERAVFDAHPAVARRLLERIPRLEEVARWVGGEPADAATEPGGVLLQAVLAYLDGLDATGSPIAALRRLPASTPAALVDALDLAAADLAPTGVPRSLPVTEIRPGMLLQEDVVTLTGMPLMRSGERVTEAVALRLVNFARTVGVREPIAVLDGV